MCCMRQCHRPQSNAGSVCALTFDQVGSIRQFAHVVDTLALQNILLALHPIAVRSVAAAAARSLCLPLENVCVHRQSSHGTETLNRLLSLLRSKLFLHNRLPMEFRL